MRPDFRQIRPIVDLLSPARSAIEDRDQCVASCGISSTVKPLPPGDRVGSVVGLLLLPVLIGGYLASVLVFKVTATAAAPWRVATLTGYAIVGAVLTDLIAGPLVGAYSGAHFWPLLPCFALITTAVALAAAAGCRPGQPGHPAGGVAFLASSATPPTTLPGPRRCPIYFRTLGVVLPPGNATNLMRNVLYFSGNNITTPLIVLFVWLLVGGAIIGYLGPIRPARMTAAANRPAAAAGPAAKPLGAAPDPTGAAPAPKSPASASYKRGALLVVLVIVSLMTCLFAFNYTDSGHAPVATSLPFGVTGSSALLTQAEQALSLKVTHYPNASAVKTAIGQAKIYGALEPGRPASTLIVVPTASDLAPLDLTTQFERAARSLHQPLKLQNYTPVPLPAKDPGGIVPYLILIPLLIGGYMCSTMVGAATGKPADRWRGAIFAGFAIVAGLVVDLIACLWLGGYATGKFWIIWPIAALIILVTAGVAALLQKLLGSPGTLVTVIVVMLFGNPSSGGPSGPPYLPGLLARHRALPTIAQRLHPAAQHPLLPRQRHHPGPRRPPRVPRRRGDHPRPDRVGPHPAEPGHPRNRSRGHRHGRPHRPTMIIGNAARSLTAAPHLKLARHPNMNLVRRKGSR